MKRTILSLALVAVAGLAMAAPVTVLKAATASAPTLESKGKCPNGKPYKITFTPNAATINGESVGVYQYTGPLGTGSNPSKDSVEVARAYVCKQINEQWYPFGNHGE
jgi:hypothetical protein